MRRAQAPHGGDTVELDSAQITEMKLELRKAKPTICPREPVRVRARLESEEQERWFEAWQGREGADKNGKLDFEAFTLQSPMGKFDGKTGWFAPNRDLLASVDREFSLAAAYKPQPNKAQATASFKPQASAA
jgi:hypothetical protein